MPKPTIGRIVHLTLSLELSSAINRDPKIRGNPTCAGETLAFEITRVWPASVYPGGMTVNGRLHTDGPDNYFMTSVPHGDIPDSWHWPKVSTPCQARLESTDGPLGQAVQINSDLPPAYTDVAVRVATLSQLELRLRRLCGHIETLGASPALTYLSVECSNTHQVLAALVEQTPLSPYHTDWLNGDHE